MGSGGNEQMQRNKAEEDKSELLSNKYCGLLLPSVRTTLGYGPGGCEAHPALVYDATHAKESFKLHQCGFQLEELDGGLPHIEDWTDRTAVASMVYPDVEQVACRASGAQIALAFDHRVRSSDGVLEGAPVFCVHSDIVLGKGPHHVKALLHMAISKAADTGDNATTAQSAEIVIDRILKERAAFVNVWLPTSTKPVAQDPLAVCDWRSRPFFLDDWDGGAVEHNPMHCWFYFSGLRAGDALVLKQWDSWAACGVPGGAGFDIAEGRTAGPPPPAREALHTAFRLPSMPCRAAARESCEVRVLLLFGRELPDNAAKSFRSAWRSPGTEEYNIFL